MQSLCRPVVGELVSAERLPIFGRYCPGAIRLFPTKPLRLYLKLFFVPRAPGRAGLAVYRYPHLCHPAGVGARASGAGRRGGRPGGAQ